MLSKRPLTVAIGARATGFEILEVNNLATTNTVNATRVAGVNEVNFACWSDYS